jgi:hypothetical protein
MVTHSLDVDRRSFAQNYSRNARCVQMASSELFSSVDEYGTGRGSDGSATSPPWVDEYGTGSGSDRVTLNAEINRSYNLLSAAYSRTPSFAMTRSLLLPVPYSSTHRDEWLTRSLPLPVLYSSTHKAKTLRPETFLLAHKIQCRIRPEGRPLSRTATGLSGT